MFETCSVHSLSRSTST